ncbi:hypothetical protein D3C87_2069950 [compost metagenome]
MPLASNRMTSLLAVTWCWARVAERSARVRSAASTVVCPARLARVVPTSWVEKNT